MHNYNNAKIGEN